MFKTVIASILFCLFAVCAFGQTANYNAPVKWERYKIGEREVSVLFPKPPVTITNFKHCSDEEFSSYAAYAGGIVYGMNIGFQTKRKDVYYGCGKKRKFNEQNFLERIKEIKSQLKTSEETKVNLNGLGAVKIKGNLFTYWLIDDFANKRWLELWISEENETAPDVKNFLESIKIEKITQGIEIGKGANRTFGDEDETVENSADAKDANAAKVENEQITPMRLIMKPRASYTDAARQAHVQGTVRVRATFLASGGGGGVVAISGLPYGLTEQAIAAAQRIVFAPMQRGGKNFSVTRIVEYSFSIY